MNLYKDKLWNISVIQLFLDLYKGDVFYNWNGEYEENIFGYNVIQMKLLCEN